MVNDSANAFDSDSESQTEMDSSDDRRRGYSTPFPRDDALPIFRRAVNTFVCPVCPAKKHRWRILDEVKDNILRMSKSVALRDKNKKKWSHHHVVARNEVWMQ
uniref:Uncharacterized protein n=1 Tax=Setaria viridis TaxID=4556 RepID=A0A4U6UYT4_SETVI|nr:hypothetical protein SEVIR_4G152300v2 [Setaria viridis]